MSGDREMAPAMRMAQQVLDDIIERGEWPALEAVSEEDCLDVIATRLESLIEENAALREACDLAASQLESMAAERAGFDSIFAYVREQINYWNKVAHDRRHAGRDDNFACAQASAHQHMEAFLKERVSTLETEGE